MRRIRDLPIGPIRFKKVRISPSSCIRFEARARDAKGAAEALRRIATVIVKDAQLPPRVIVDVEIDQLCD
jgi:hypothetical protein